MHRLLPFALVLACWGAVPDKFVPAEPEGQRLWGPVGDRLKANLQELLKADEDALLAPYEKRPGVDARSGEAVGRFLEAAAGAYRYQKEQRLKVLLDRVAKRLLSTQLPNGYLGTYAEPARWSGWDVATHQSNLRGLLAYWRVSGDERALAASRRIGELLAATFGPDKRDIVAATADNGWAGTAVLGGICLLHGATGEARFLQFARYLAGAWSQPSGPQLLARLVNEGSVGASPESVLPSLIGMVELYRITADERLWLAVVAAQEQLSAAGSGVNSLPAWAEFNWHLLRLTGETKYAAQIEASMASLAPALLPYTVAGAFGGGVALELYPEGTLVVPGPAGKPLRFEFSQDKVTLVEGEGRFPLYLRVTKLTSATVGGKRYTGRAGRYLMLDRQWAAGDVVEWVP